MASTARQMLKKAEFFVSHADKAGKKDRGAFSTFLEAAIVFGRSVTWYLQKQYNRQPGFKDWDSAMVSEMRKDPVFNFMRDQRNYILKEGPSETEIHASITIEDTVLVSTVGEVTVIRGNPWYKRSISIWAQDIRAKFTRMIRILPFIKRNRRNKSQSRTFTNSDVKYSLHFAHDGWRDRAATDVVREYLCKLEPFVTDAEKQFGGAVTD